MSDPAIVSEGGVTVSSSSETPAQIRAILSPEKAEAPDLSKAASELGKKGGQAAAKARAEAEKENAEPDRSHVGDPGAGKADHPEPGVDREPQSAAVDTETSEERKSRAKERVEQATREAAELKRELARERENRERAERERDEERRARSTPAREERQPEARAEGKPKVEDFDEYEQYLDARDQYNRRSWQAEHEQQEKARRQHEHTRGVVKTYAQAMKAAEAADPQFWDTLSEDVAMLEPTVTIQGRPTGKNFIADILVAKPTNAAALMRHFSEQAAEFKRISGLSNPYEIAYEVGKIEARLEGATAGNPSSDERQGSNPELSLARPPARPVAVSPRTAESVPGEDASYEAHKRYWNAKDRAARR